MTLIGDNSIDNEALELAREKLLKALLEEERRKKCCTIKPRRDLIEVTSIEGFRRAVSGCRLALGFFYTPTCPYCRMMEPLVRAAAELLGDRMMFFKINAARLYEVAGAFYIMGTPTIIAFRRGREVDRLVGLVPVEVFEEFLTRLLESEGCPIPTVEQAM